MTTYLLLYRSPVSARQQMADATPEQAQAGMDAWMAWAGTAGSAITDLGSPLALADTVGATSSDDTIGGYSIMEAGSVEELRGLLEATPAPPARRHLDRRPRGAAHARHVAGAHALTRDRPDLLAAACWWMTRLNPGALTKTPQRCRASSTETRLAQ